MAAISPGFIHFLNVRQFLPHVLIIAAGLFSSGNASCQWIPSHTFIPPINGYAWYEFAFNSVDTGYLAVNWYQSVSTGYSYDLLKTTNGGISWAKKETLPEPDTVAGLPGSYIIDMAFPHADTLMLTGASVFNYLSRLDPGGYHEFRFFMDLPVDLSVINGREAWILTRKLFPVALSLFHFINDTLYRVLETDTLTVVTGSRVFFPSSNTGYIIAQHNQENVMLKTVNGGGFFSKVIPPAGQVPSVTWFTSDSSGFLACESGNIYHTGDQCNSWTLLSSGLMSGPADIHFHGDSLGMVCGSGGKVLMTTDGGLSWANHPGNGNLTSVEVFTPDRAYVCNNDYFPVFYKGIYPVTVAEREKEGVVVFPNPATDQLNIVCDAGPGQEKERFEIFDLSGKILRTGQVQGKITLDISGLPSGIYGIRLLRKNQVLIRRFVRL